MSNVLLSLALVASLGYCPHAVAQQPVPVLPAYDIVVIKPNNSLVRGMNMDMDEASRWWSTTWNSPSTTERP